MNKLGLACAIAVMIAIGGARLVLAQALAETQTAASSPSLLDAVVVTAGRGEETLRSVVSNFTLITREDIEKAPDQRVDYLLRRQGIHLLQYPGQASSAVQIRGIRNPGGPNPNVGNIGSRILILVDGRPAGTGNLATIMKTNVERIEIIRGPAAITYGSQSAGGVINIITKRGEGDLKARAQVGFGSFSYSDQEFGVDGRYNNVDYSLGFFHSRVNDYKDGSGDKLKGTDSKGVYFGSVNLGYNFLDDLHRIGLVAQFYDNDFQGTGGDISSFGPSYENGNFDTRSSSFDLLYTGKDQNNFLSWQLRYFHAKEEKANYGDRERNELQSKEEVITNGVQGQFGASWQYLDLTAGFEWQKYDFKNFSPSSVPVSRKTNLKNIAGFLLAKGKVFDEKLILSSGVRFDKFTHNASGSDKNVDNVSYTFGVAYLPVDWLKIRADVAKGFRAPTASELASDYIGWGSRYKGNPNLDPETNTTYEFGFDIDNSFLHIDATYFNSDYKKYIVSTWDVINSYNTWINQKDGTKIAGYELGVSFYLGRTLNADFALTPYFKGTFLTKRRAYDSNRKEIIQRLTPKTNFSYGLDFDYPKIGFSANINANYIGKMLDTWPDGAIVASYTLVDIGLKKELVTFADRHKLSLIINAYNIFDKHYEPKLDYPGPGKSYYAALRYDFN
ncbi:MAG: TonB-dependent receptor [Deltaproteobacteria bacterium]|jgi:vitamin B12 transporter|nr:TonB-dependent receptor [Deltaproteobacteria bacterium]